MIEDFTKSNQLLLLFSTADTLLKVHKRGKDNDVLEHFNWVMNRAADLLGSMTQEEFEYCDRLTEFWGETE